MYDNVVTRYGPGLNNTVDIKGGSNGILSDIYVPDRIGKVHEFSYDFDSYAAADWTQQLNAGTIALVAGDGGLLALTSAVSAITSQEDNPASFQLAKGFRTWYRTVFSVDAVLGLTINGLLNATATPFTAGSQTDGAFFLSDNTGALSFVVAVGGTKLTTAMGVNLVAGQFATLGWYYDGGCYAAAPLGRLVYEASGPGVTAPVRGEVAIPASGTIAAFPGAVNIGAVMGVSASTAVARVLTVDYVYAAKDRQNINVSPTF